MGIIKFRQRPQKSPVGVKFKFSYEHSLPFHMGAQRESSARNARLANRFDATATVGRKECSWRNGRFLLQVKGHGSLFYRY